MTEPSLDFSRSAKAPLSNAERQRRYRERHSDPDLKGEVNPPDILGEATTPRNESEEISNDADGEPASDASSNLQASLEATVLCAQQDEVRIAFNDDGDAILTQRNWPEEDSVIIISRENLDTFLDKLCDVLGIPSFGGP
jgi:hypothetical protein